jgi:hypothetical protein
MKLTIGFLNTTVSPSSGSGGHCYCSESRA